MTRPRIVCLGEAMVEERVAPDGTLTAHYGGDTLNTAIHLARLGCDVGYATAVGCDEESDALIAALQDEGLDTSLVLRHPDRTVGRYRITVDADGERTFSYDRAHSAARAMFEVEGSGTWPGIVGGSDCFMFSLISLAILTDAARRRLLELAAQSRLTAYDGNYRPALWGSADAARKWHDEAIALASIGLPTFEDEATLRGAGDAEEVAAHWSRLGCEEVMVKAGAAGCRLPDGEMLAPPRKLSPIDTSGAGDAFNAGYLAARLRGREPKEAAIAGHRLAGWTIMQPGAIPRLTEAAPYREIR